MKVFLVLVGAGIGYLLGKKQGKREREQKKLKNESLSSSSISRDKDKESTRFPWSLPWCRAILNLLDEFLTNLFAIFLKTFFRAHVLL